MKRLTLILAVLLAWGCQEPLTPLRPGPRPPTVCDEDLASVGPTPLRRLTRTQYQHAVEDVLGAEGDFASGLSEDERVAGFPTNVSVSIDRVMLDAYLDAADAVVASVDLAALDDCDRLTEDPAACASRFIATYGRLLYRRPLDLQQANRLFVLYTAYPAEHRRGLQMVLRAMLVSPRFLYHDDYTVRGDPVDGRVALDPFAVASRLSFFLWHGVPDAELLDAAASGALDEPDGVREQARRMLDDPRAARGIGAFVTAWLGLENLPEATRDPSLYPSFGPALGEAMVEETAAFADSVVRRGDGSLRTLLTASWSIVPESLHAHYGLPDGSPTDAPVELDPTQRAGIVTHASVLAAHAHHQTSSLTLRGKLIRERLFCQDLPDPPPGVSTTVPEPRPGATTRQRFAAHVESPTCASCHRYTDPIGFALESFDAIGRWRELDQGLPVDDTGGLEGTDVDRAVEGPIELAAALADSVEVERCVARQVFRYAIGRRETAADGCTLASLEEAMQAPDDLRALLLAIVTSDAFRYRLAGEAS